MKKFFENYGFVALAAIVVISLISIAKPVGGGIQSATTSIVGSFQNRVVDSANEINNHNRISPNTVIKINGDNYVVLENNLDNKYLVMKLQPIGEFPFNNSEYNNQDNSTCYYNSDSDFEYKGCSNIYENSSVDKYLNEVYYESLPFKDAIVKTDITQSFYKQTYKNDKFKWNNDEKTWHILENGTWVSWIKYNPIKGEKGGFSFSKAGDQNDKGEKSRRIQRNVFLPSVDEVSKIINVDDQYQVGQIVKSDKNNNIATSFSLRDAVITAHTSLTIHPGSFSLHGGFLKETWMDVRPAFVIDLSKVEYINTNDQFIK